MSALRCWVVIEHDDEGRILMVKAFEDKELAVASGEELVRQIADGGIQSGDEAVEVFHRHHEWRGFSSGVSLVYSE